MAKIARPKVTADILAGIEIAMGIVVPAVKDGTAKLNAHDTHLVQQASQWVEDTKKYREWRMANPQLTPNVHGAPQMHRGYGRR